MTKKEKLLRFYWEAGNPFRGMKGSSMKKSKWFSIRRSPLIEFGIVFTGMGFCENSILIKKRIVLTILIGRCYILIGPQG
jgi:hypothetical protein